MFKPLFSSPTKYPMAPPLSPNWRTAVGDPLTPSFFSIERQVTSFFLPILPSSLGMNFGTMKTDIPLFPSGASGVFAKTK